MRPLHIAIPILATTAALAQTQLQPPSKPPQQFQVPDTFQIERPSRIRFLFLPDCPVSLWAQQRGVGETLWTISQEDAPKPNDKALAKVGEVGVHVELSALNQANIRQVELAVFYVPSGRRFLPASQTFAETTYRRKVFTLSTGDVSTFKLSGNLLVGAAAGILRVHVTSIQYTDGTSWHELPNRGCSVEPNRFLPVAAR